MAENGTKYRMIRYYIIIIVGSTSVTSQTITFFVFTFVSLPTLFLQYPRTKTYMEVRNFTLTSQLLIEGCEIKRDVNPRHEKM